jgi:DNA-directed RNA polymerase specialized sigma subunit
VEIGVTQMQVSRLLTRILRDLRRSLVETAAPA